MDRGVAGALISHALRDVQAQGYGRDADRSSAELRLYEGVTAPIMPRCGRR